MNHQPTGTCKECGCTTGGGEYCYRHAPYMVYPLKDGSYRSDRNGRHFIWWDEPPSPESEASIKEDNHGEYTERA